MKFCREADEGDIQCSAQWNEVQDNDKEDEWSQLYKQNYRAFTGSHSYTSFSPKEVDVDCDDQVEGMEGVDMLLFAILDDTLNIQ